MEYTTKEKQEKKVFKKFEGVGLSARPLHFSKLLKNPTTSWIEILIDNYLENSLAERQLEKLSSHYKLTFHSTSLNLGGTDLWDESFLKKMKVFVKKFKPALLSDHLCFTSHKGHHFHDLLPLDCNKKTASYLIDRILFLQDYFQTPFAIENISSYLDFHSSELEEMEFINFVCEKAQCFLLLDLNNIYVNSLNRKKEAYETLKKIDPKHVAQYHVAGFVKTKKGYAIDTHSQAVSKEVYELLKKL